MRRRADDLAVHYGVEVTKRRTEAGVCILNPLPYKRTGWKCRYVATRRKGEIKNEIQNGTVLHLNDRLPSGSEGYLTETPVGERPDLVPTSDKSISGTKVTVNPETANAEEQN